MKTTYEFTRPELAQYLRVTFDRMDLVGRKDVLKALREEAAPAEMVELVAARIPEGTRMTDMRSLWTYLGDVPVAREAA